MGLSYSKKGGFVTHPKGRITLKIEIDKSQNLVSRVPKFSGKGNKGL